MNTSLRSALNELEDPVEVLIGGVPGTLKTSTATLLGASLGIPVVGTDQIRAVQRIYDPSPFLAGETHTRWELLGDEASNLTRGVSRQSELVREAVLDASAENLRRGEHFIFEGAHLLPQLYPKAPRRLRVLLYDQNLERLARRMRGKFAHREELADRWGEEKVEQLGAIQQWLLETCDDDVRLAEARRPEYCSACIEAWLEEMI